MIFRRCVVSLAFVLAVGFGWGFQKTGPAAEPAVAQKVPRTVRGLAVVDFGFEEPAGDAKDAAILGSAADAGQLKNGTRRVDSPFWGQAGKKAMLLTAGRKQFIEIPDGPDVDRPDAVTASFFFLNLHPLNDKSFHGIIAKRAESSAGSATNYGINYHPMNDAFQVYINDGSGFRSVVYSVKEVVNTTRLVHLSVVWEVGDAPAPDADADRDDLRVHLYLNGRSVTPKSVSKGQIAGSDGWLPDINVPKLLNNVPVTLGASTPTTEFASGLIDEFLLFGHALNDEEAARLFHEVAGPNADQLAKQEASPPAAVSPRPTITTTTLHGFEAGHSTRLTISGSNLQPNPKLVLPGVSLEQKVLAGSNAGRLNVEVTLPGDCPLGRFPLFVETDQGVSLPIRMAIDTLPQRSADGTSPEQPAKLPAAFSGQIAGGNAARIYFQGQAGDRVAAEVEAKRLGSVMDPVVEIKTARGTPLVIGWGHTLLRGDARVELRLPEDGVYFAEVHDLTYKAPGQNRFRLELGDFRSVDQWFPAKIEDGNKITLKPLGQGIPAGSELVAQLPKNGDAEMLSPKFLAGWKAVGPTPPLRFSQAVEVTEAAPQTGLQNVNATFEKEAHLPVVINGIVAKPGEEDRYLLNVTPGQKLRFTVETRSLSSPLDALFTVRNHPQGNIVIYKEDSGTDRDPAADFAVPANVKQIEVGVQDLNERGGAEFLYRLKILPAGAPDFALAIKSSSLTLPAEGTAVAEMTLTHKNYAGPIKLRVAGDPAVSVIPSEIPKGQGNQELFVTFVRKGNKNAQGFQGLKLIGESVGLKPELTHAATVAPAAGTAALPGFSTLLPASIGSAAKFQIEVSKLPAALFKGVPARIGVKVQRQGEQASNQAVLLSLLTTEPTRPNDPKDPKKGNKPKIRAPQNQAVGPKQDEGVLRVAVPVDVAIAEIDAVIKAELVPHAYSSQVSGTVYSYPFKLPVKTAAEVALDKNTLNLSAGKPNAIKGTITRMAPFRGPVNITLSGLPKGYQVKEAQVPGNAGDFEISLTPAAEAQAKTVKASLSVQLPSGAKILPDRAVELKVAPGS